MVAECLARPILAERLFTSALTYRDVSWTVGQPRNSHKRDGAAFHGYTLPLIATTLKEDGTIIVTNTNDSGPGSLRQALADANDGDVIGFAVTGTSGLTSGELLVAKNVTISGPGTENLAVNGNNQSRVFHITSGRTVTISGLTITNGSAGSGGGIYNDHAVLILSNCTISGNSGDGIHNDGHNIGHATLKINNSLLTNNSGGIYNDAMQAGLQHW